MQLLILILKDLDCITTLITSLAEAGVKGGTLLEGKGMANILMKQEEVPIFGMLRHLMNDTIEEKSHVLLFVLQEEQVLPTKSTIKRITGDLNKPGAESCSPFPSLLWKDWVNNHGKQFIYTFGHCSSAGTFFQQAGKETPSA